MQQNHDRASHAWAPEGAGRPRTRATGEVDPAGGAEALAAPGRTEPHPLACDPKAD
jgi:hypothetical protein